MKTWYALTCPVCGFRYPLRKFATNLASINYPVQLVTGGGRAKGFQVAQRMTWANLRSLNPTSDLMHAINREYWRLAEAYDNFHFYLGYLSPSMKDLIDSLRQEIFQLQTEVHMLTSKVDRLELTNTIKRRNQIGGIEGIVDRIRQREDREAKERTELLTRLYGQTRNRVNQRGTG